MDERDFQEIVAWTTHQALAGSTEHALLEGFAERLHAAGVPINSAAAIIDTLHPIWEGRAFLWRNDGKEEEHSFEYGSTSEGEAAERWQRTSFYYLVEQGVNEVRRRIGFGDPVDFYLLDELKDEGYTDYLAMLQRFDGVGVIGKMDAVYSHWGTQNPRGFTEEDCAALRRLVPTLALALKCVSLNRITETLAEVYLGKDAARRVLSGLITRGRAERIHAVLWFSDLRGFTTLADAIVPEEVIPLLNDYAEVTISIIHEHGGDVLKLIGDGILAIFQSPEAATAALAAAREMKRRVVELNERRREAGHPITTVRLGLHVGEVFYGNIGSDERLDFTVVGPAVNEVSRIVSMCRSVDRDLLASKAYVSSIPVEEQKKFASVGRFALRGVQHGRELFTLDEG